MVPDISKVPTTIAVMLGLMLAAGLVQYAMVEVSGSRQANADTNPAVFAAFHAIEARCLDEPLESETARCRGALATLRDCAGSVDDCTAQEYYCDLARLGFNLPPFYVDDSAHLNRRVC